jgi:predicted ATPase/class 3 adenylate cyclase
MFRSHMRDLPTGTVTFLFTDIEGSTRLLQELGDQYAGLRDDHAAIVRQAIARRGGVEVSTAGDSFFVVFAEAAGAVAAAVDANRDLAAHDWPDGAEIRIRSGLHTGEGTLGGDDYVGLDVNRAARIAAAAHGGQVILSDATRSLVDDALPDGVALRKLGRHRLKDIERPERLFDLAIDGLPQEFPPPRTLDARPNNLPAQLTSFVGRDDEIAEVRELLQRSRLVTLTGAGGSGKTRLALRLAADVLTEFDDGAFFVDLSSVVDPALVPSAIAHALGCNEVPGSAMEDVVREHLRDRELLLVVDNFEQVVSAAPLIEDLLAAAPRLRVVATSRIVLSVPGEHEYVVPPLEPPDPERLPDLLTLGRFDAVRLFVERAAAADPRFRVTEANAAAVAEITARLDGLPLAIELAATRTRVLTPEQMLPRLQSRLTLLTSGARTLPERQRTLRGAIAWSHDLLNEPERALFARLSAFTGGWTIEAAEAVCRPEEIGLDALDGLTALVEMSLVRRSDRDEADARFTMLETIREFAQERLRESPAGATTLGRHATFYLALAAEAEPHLTADDQGEWLDRCDLEHANIRAALRWALDAGRADEAMAAAGALWRFWQQRSHLAEGSRWFDEILAADDRPIVARAKALIGAGGIAWWRQDRDQAGRRYAEAVEIERHLGDPGRTAEAIYNLSFVVAGDDVDAAAGMLEECLELFRQADDERGVAQTLTMLVIRDAQADRWAEVAASLEEVVAIWHRVGERLHLAFDIVWLSFAYGRLGRLPEAWKAGLEAMELFRKADNPTGIGIVFSNLAFLATWSGRHREAVVLEGAATAVKAKVGGPPGGFAGILEDDPAEEARAHLDAADADRAFAEGQAMSVDEAVQVARRTAGS